MFKEHNLAVGCGFSEVLMAFLKTLGIMTWPLTPLHEVAMDIFAHLSMSYMLKLLFLSFEILLNFDLFLSYAVLPCNGCPIMMQQY